MKWFEVIVVEHRDWSVRLVQAQSAQEIQDSIGYEFPSLIREVVPVGSITYSGYCLPPVTRPTKWLSHGHEQTNQAVE